MDELSALRSELDDLRRRNAELTRQLDVLQKRAEQATGAVHRREAMRMLGLAAAAGVGVVAGSVAAGDPADAAPGTPLAEGANTPTTPYITSASLSGDLLQLSNAGNGGALTASGSGVSPTVHLSTGSGGQPALQVDAQGNIPVIVVKGPARFEAAVSTGPVTIDASGSGSSAIQATAVNLAVAGSAVAVGVQGSGLVGVKGIGTGLAGGGIGIEASGDTANARYPLQGSTPWTRGSGPAQATHSYLGGELAVDENGNWWACVTPGSGPESWRLLTGPQAAGTFVPVVPQRIYDSRNGDGPLGPDAERTITVPASLPAGVSAVLVNVTTAQTTGAGFLAVFPGGIGWPGTSTVNWSGAGQAVANAITVLLGNRKLTVRAGVGTTQVVLDLYGYHR